MSTWSQGEGQTSPWLGRCDSCMEDELVFWHGGEIVCDLCDQAYGKGSVAWANFRYTEAMDELAARGDCD